MSRAHAVIVEDDLRIPADAFTFAGFRRWVSSNHTLEAGRYKPVRTGAAGWLHSPRLGTSFRLTRRRTPIGTWRYVLESKPGAASSRS